MSNNINVFVLWANGRHKETEILSVIQERFEILQTYEIIWNSKYFTQNLSRFYGKKLPCAYRKKKLCGTGSFLVICINDPLPQIYDNKNLNLTSVKHHCRQILGGNYLHASDYKTEAEENLLLLTGLSPTELPQTPHPQALTPIILHQDLVGTPTWESEEQLLDFINKIPQIQFCSPNIVLTKDVKQTARFLNAKRKILSFSRNNYKIPINHKNHKFIIKQS